MYSLKSYSSILKESGIKPSFQRVKIMEYLKNNLIHPTVNDIYDALIDEIPSLSKTTVYNTLNLMKEHSLVRVLNIDEVEARYDINVSMHGHFMCKKCGEVKDVPISTAENIFCGMEDYELDTIDVNLVGVCPECRKKEKLN